MSKVILSASLTSLSRKRSHKSPRASFMSLLMTKLGGDPGNAIAEAFVKPDPEKFQELMTDVVDKMTRSIKRAPPKVESASEESKELMPENLKLGDRLQATESVGRIAKKEIVKVVGKPDSSTVIVASLKGSVTLRGNGLRLFVRANLK